LFTVHRSPSGARAKTVVVFIGLPYTGKTTLIQRLQEKYAGEAIFADAVFMQITPPSQIGLARWLQEGPRLVERIQTMIRQSSSQLIFVELGTMRAKQRAQLIRRCRDQGYAVIPIWCRCDDDEALQQRRQTRVEEIGAGGRREAKIDITLDDLYARIRAAFEEPTPAEGFIEIDTSRRLEENLDALCQIINKAKI